jgi:pyruvate formate lyase activating enzyme
MNSTTTSHLHPARWWEPAGRGKLLCTLCPRYCELGEGQHGFCYIRQNIGGELYSLGYGKPTGFGLDPIEKKPLNHFLPGTQILSFGTAGCNLGCKFCQNWSISKAKIDTFNAGDCSPDDIVRLAIENKAPSIAYTYNDPVIFGEYVVDVSAAAREHGLKNVMVTAGYIDKNARREVFANIDAANVDLKAFSESFYYKLTSSHLKDVLDTLFWLKHETNIWFELTTLLIPGANDSPDEISAMCDWILKNLGDDVPLHFTAFHPDFKMRDKRRTPSSTLLSARSIALEAGLHYCYVGNIVNPEGQTTYCPTCKMPLIERDWHTLLSNELEAGCCPRCSTKIAGVF